MTTKLGNFPQIIHIGNDVTIRESSGKTITIGTKHQYKEWTLMSIISDPKEDAIAVFEDLGNHGSILFSTKNGVKLELKKTLEPTSINEESLYFGYNIAEITFSDRDILGSEILARDGDPDFNIVKNCVPPIRAVNTMNNGSVESPHTFVGTKESADLVPIFYNVRTSAWRVNPLYVSLEIEKAIKEKKVMEGLVGGWLPVVRMVYPVDNVTFWESLTFAKTDIITNLIQPVWYRYTKIKKRKIEEIHYFDSYLPYPLEEEPQASDFYIDLYNLHSYWNKNINPCMIVKLPDAWISDFCKHSFVLEMIARIGNHPKYGIVDKNYGGAEHDGFQDILTTSVESYLEWGMSDIARQYFDYYLTYFIRPDGRIEYRGPEIGQYARMLELLSLYYNYTNDSSLAVKHKDKIMAIEVILLSRNEKALKKSPDDPEYGMIAGRHEADISFLYPSLLSEDFERPYFSNSALAWRGLRDIRYMWEKIGEEKNVVALITHGKELILTAETLQKNIVASMEGSLLYDRGSVFLPPIAGTKKYYYDRPFRSFPDSYDDNRVWCEMMRSGVVPRKYIDILLTHAVEHQGMKLGFFGNRYHAVVFLCYGEAYGFIHHDMIREFLLLYYSLLTHMHTRGTWSVFECVDIDRERGKSLGFCPPAQLAVTMITKWMLVFDDPLVDVIWLAKAVPRSWLEDGKRIVIKDAPTRWGVLSYMIESKFAKEKIVASIESRQDIRAEIILRLRLPEAYKICSVAINGKSWENIDSAAETVTLPALARCKIHVEVFCAENPLVSWKREKK